MGVAPIIDFFVVSGAGDVATDTTKLNKISNAVAAGSSLPTGYDNLGSVALGSQFSFFRQIWNNKSPVSDVSTATDLRFTLHRSMTTSDAQAVQPGSSGEEDGAVAAGPPGVIVDEGINPPSTYVDQNQWVIGHIGPGASASTTPDQLWTKVTVVKQGGNNTSDMGGKIGYLLNAQPPSYQFHEVPGTIQITGAQASAFTNYITIKLDITIPNAFTGSGNLYSRLHLEYKFT